jgi:hydrogenase maturation protease
MSLPFRPGDRVRLRPRRRADALDVVLAGMTAIVEKVEEDFEGRVHLSITLEDDPGRDLGVAGKPGHRFFFEPEDVEWLGHDPAVALARPTVRESELLIAGIGNPFLGDDAFGVEVARLLSTRPLPPGVVVKDFGTRGFDLACALTGGCGGAILVDAMDSGDPPGTVRVIEPEAPSAGLTPVEGHSLHPVAVLRLARALGAVCPWLRVVGCQPFTFGTPEEPVLGLSAPVAAVVGPAVEIVERQVRIYLDARNASCDVV